MMGCPLVSTVSGSLGTELPLQFILAQGEQAVSSGEQVTPALQSAAGQNSVPAGQPAARSIDTYSL